MSFRKQLLSTSESKFITGLGVMMFLAMTTALSVSLVQRPTIMPRAAGCDTYPLYIGECREEPEAVTASQKTGKSIGANIDICNSLSIPLDGININVVQSAGQPSPKVVLGLVGQVSRIYAGECQAAPISAMLTDPAQTEWEGGNMEPFDFFVEAVSAYGAYRSNHQKVEVTTEILYFCGDGLVREEDDEECDPPGSSCETTEVSDGECDNDCLCEPVEEEEEGIFSIEVDPTEAGPGDSIEIIGTNIPIGATEGVVSFIPSSNLDGDEDEWVDDAEWSGEMLEVTISADACRTRRSERVRGRLKVETEGTSTSASDTTRFYLDCLSEDGDVPAAPSDFSATPYSGTQINLFWTDNATNEDGFKIYRSLTEGDYPDDPLETVGENLGYYEDTDGLDPETTYYYKLVAFNSVGQSDEVIASATTRAAGCGDGTCAEGEGEDETNCPADCAFAIVVRPDRQTPGGSINITGSNIPTGTATADVFFDPNPAGGTDRQQWADGAEWTPATDPYLLSVTLDDEATVCTAAGLSGEVAGRIIVEAGSGASAATAWDDFTLACPSGGGPSGEVISGLIDINNYQSRLKEVRVHHREVGGTAGAPLVFPLHDSPYDVDLEYEITGVYSALTYEVRAELDFLYSAGATTTTYCNPRQGGEPAPCGDEWRRVSGGTSGVDLVFDLVGQEGRVSGVVTIKNPGGKTMNRLDVEVVDDAGAFVNDAFFAYLIPSYHQRDRLMTIPFEVPPADVSPSPLETGKVYGLRAKIDVDGEQPACSPNCRDTYELPPIPQDRGISLSEDTLIVEVPSNPDEIGVVVQIDNVPESDILKLDLKRWRNVDGAAEPSDVIKHYSDFSCAASYPLETCTLALTSAEIDPTGNDPPDAEYNIKAILQYKLPDDSPSPLVVQIQPGPRGNVLVFSLVIPPIQQNDSMAAAKLSVDGNSYQYITKIHAYLEKSSDQRGWDTLHDFGNIQVGMSPNLQEFWIKKDDPPVADYYRFRAQAKGTVNGQDFDILPVRYSDDFTDLPYVYGDDEDERGLFWNLRPVGVAAADVNGDSRVDVLDYSYLVSAAGCWTDHFDPRADLNENGRCNVADIESFVIAWTILSHYD